MHGGSNPYGAGRGVASALQPEIWCLNMHGVQELVTYSSYKSQSGLTFAEQYWSYMPSSSMESVSP